MNQIDIKQKFKQGIALHKQGKLQEALDIYCDIIEKIPEHADALYLSGVAFHQKGNDEIAAELIQNAIKYNSSNPEYYTTLVSVYNNLGLFFQEQGDIPKAMESYNNALELDPGYTLALNNIGLIYQEHKEYDSAEKFYKKAIKTDPSFYEAWLNLGNVLQDQQKHDDSLNCYNKALELNPSSFQVYNSIGTLLKSNGNPDLAKKKFKRAVELNPEYSEAYYNLGCIYQEEGDNDEAIGYYLKCIEVSPDYAQAYTNIGNVFLTKKMFNEAESYYLKAMEISPDFAEAYNNAGSLYQSRNELEKAIEYLEKATVLAPDIPEFHLNLGITHRKFGDLTKAFDSFMTAIELVPDFAEPWFNLGEVHKDLGRFNEAIDCYEKTLELKPDSDTVIDQLAITYQRICKWDNAERCIKQIINLTEKSLNAGEAVAGTPHNCMTRRDDPLLCYRVAKSWSEEISAEVAIVKEKFTFGNKRKEKDKIRVGYLSNTFLNHPGGHLIAGLFGEHNRDAFEIFAYSYGPDDESYYRKKIESESDSFIDISGVGDEEAATMINRDEIDILVDLRGYTKNSRPKICALRPSPVQVVYLGFPGSSGAEFYDYLIADKTIVPQEHLQYFSENIVYMPDCYQVNNNDQPISEAVFSRKEAGLPEDGLVFCSFNTEYKVEPVMFSCWMEILKTVPNSVLWLLSSSEEVSENLSKEAESRGVNKNRLVFAKQMAKDKHLKRSQLADIAFDTKIVNGHTTTSDALWAGLPVITMPGNHFSSRVSASILKAAGLPELVVTTLEEYKELAVELSLNEDMLKKLKTKVEENRRTESLFDTQLFASNIEKAYKIMWDRFKNDSPHDLIEI